MARRSNYGDVDWEGLRDRLYKFALERGYTIARPRWRDEVEGPSLSAMGQAMNMWLREKKGVKYPGMEKAFYNWVPHPEEGRPTGRSVPSMPSLRLLAEFLGDDPHIWYVLAGHEPPEVLQGPTCQSLSEGEREWLDFRRKLEADPERLELVRQYVQMQTDEADRARLAQRARENGDE